LSPDHLRKEHTRAWPVIGLAALLLVVPSGVVSARRVARARAASAERARVLALLELEPALAATPREVLDAVSSLDARQRASQVVQLQLERALVAGVVHVPEIAAELGDRVGTLPPELQPAVVRAIARARPGAVSVLERLLGSDVELDRVLLAELGRVDPRDRQALRGRLAARFRAYLAHADARLRAQAALALGQLHDFDSVPRLIALLDEQGPAQAAALQALRLVAGAGVVREIGATRAETGHWREWHRAESAWLERDLPRLEREVRAVNPERPGAALAELERHAHLRDALAPLVVTALGHADPAVVTRACALGARARCDAALPALVQALEREESSVRAAALAALRSISGLDGPLEAAWWGAWLAG
jgi:hypothetical protein